MLLPYISANGKVIKEGVYVRRTSEPVTSAFG